MTYQPSVCVITPTIGRPSLKRTLESASIEPGDRWTVISDGPNKQAEMIFSEAIGPWVYFSETHDVRGDYGNPLRDMAMAWAKQDYFIFLDDDDVFVPGAMEIIKHEIKEHRPRPIIFRMINGNGEVLWRNREVTPGNVGGSMFCCPNKLGLLGVWANGAAHRSDYEFIMGTLKKYGPAWRQNIFWSDKVIIHCRPEA